MSDDCNRAYLRRPRWHKHDFVHNARHDWIPLQYCFGRNLRSFPLNRVPHAPLYLPGTSCVFVAQLTLVSHSRDPQAGNKDEGLMFLLTDSQITNERFLIYVNDLLASGNIPDLFAVDEVDAIVSGVCCAQACGWFYTCSVFR